MLYITVDVEQKRELLEDEIMKELKCSADAIAEACIDMKKKQQILEMLIKGKIREDLPLCLRLIRIVSCM